MNENENDLIKFFDVGHKRPCECVNCVRMDTVLSLVSNLGAANTLVEQQAARIAELERDATRYKWLRQHVGHPADQCDVLVDAALDAARSKP